jgi:GNAT superfamily N-acetyltransferase
MTADDLLQVAAVASIVHPGFPEDAAVYADRLALYPAGCFVLPSADGLAGYAISHPWHDGAPPALNTVLGHLPEPSSLYYIHDVALLPAVRGSGAGNAVAATLIDYARRAGFTRAMLIAVNNSEDFWQRSGFAPVAAHPYAAKLATYGEGVTLMARTLDQ